MSRILPRPENDDFGRTTAKKHAKYVYSLQGGQLLHEVAEVVLTWYGLVSHDTMERLDSPSVMIQTKCGYTFHLGKKEWGKRRIERSKMCELPKPDAVLCGRCQGSGPVFTKNGKPSRSGITKQEAKARLGCVVAIGRVTGFGGRCLTFSHPIK